MANEAFYYYMFWSFVLLGAGTLVAALLNLFWKLVLWSWAKIWPDEEDNHRLLDASKVPHHHRGSQGDVWHGADSGDYIPRGIWTSATDKEEGIQKF